MYEKLSEESIRREKVNKLKEKFLVEVEKQIQFYQSELKSNIGSEDFISCIKYGFALCELQEYLQQDKCFMDYTIKYYDRDLVQYVIPKRDLDVWLQTDYPFVMDFLDRIVDHYKHGFPVLRDKYFVCNFAPLNITKI